MGVKPSPVTIQGVTYPSARAAAAALGVSPKTIYGAIYRGREGRIGVGVGAPMPVTIRGVAYPSARHAAEALGVTVHAVYSGLCKGYIDRVGLGTDYASRKVKGGRPRAVIVAGRSFQTIAELARFLGRDPSCVRVSLRSGPEAQGRIVRAVMAETARIEQRQIKLAEMWDQPGHQRSGKRAA